MSHSNELFPTGNRDWGLTWPNVAGIAIIEELAVLEAISRRIPESGRMLEIGSWCCSSICWLADRHSSAEFVACDSWPSDGHAWRRLLLSIVNVAMRDNVRLWWGSSSRFGKICRDGAFDVVFVDGDHEQAAVASDLATAARLVADGGSIFAHDYGHHKWQGVRLAVDEFVGNSGFAIVNQIRSLVELRRA